MTSNPSSSQSWPCPHAATSACRTDVGEESATLRLHTPGSEAAASLPRPPPPARRLDDSQGGPGVGSRVPSSATVAAQPDRRNLLARGHLWASGKSLSSSSGTDIQQDRQDDNAALLAGAPRRSWPATLPGRPLFN